MTRSTTHFAGFVLGDHVSYLYLATLNSGLPFGSGLTFIPFDQTFVSADAALTNFSFGGAVSQEGAIVLRNALLRLFKALGVQGLPTTTKEESAALYDALDKLTTLHAILSNEEVEALLKAASPAERDALVAMALEAMGSVRPTAPANDT